MWPPGPGGPPATTKGRVSSSSPTPLRDRMPPHNRVGAVPPGAGSIGRARRRAHASHSSPRLAAAATRALWAVQLAGLKCLSRARPPTAPPCVSPQCRRPAAAARGCRPVARCLSLDLAVIGPGGQPHRGAPTPGTLALAYARASAGVRRPLLWYLHWLGTSGTSYTRRPINDGSLAVGGRARLREAWPSSLRSSRPLPTAREAESACRRMLFSAAGLSSP